MLSTVTSDFMRFIPNPKDPGTKCEAALVIGDRAYIIRRLPGPVVDESGAEVFINICHNPPEIHIDERQNDAMLLHFGALWLAELREELDVCRLHDCDGNELSVLTVPGSGRQIPLRSRRRSKPPELAEWKKFCEHMREKRNQSVA